MGCFAPPWPPASLEVGSKHSSTFMHTLPWCAPGQDYRGVGGRAWINWGLQETGVQKEKRFSTGYKHLESLPFIPGHGKDKGNVNTLLCQLDLRITECKYLKSKNSHADSKRCKRKIPKPTNTKHSWNRETDLYREFGTERWRLEQSRLESLERWGDSSSVAWFCKKHQIFTDVQIWLP